MAPADQTHMAHMLRFAVPLLILATLSGGCVVSVADFPGVGRERFDALMMEKVRTKAAFDLQCEAAAMQVTRIDRGVYGVTGCGHRVSYVGKDLLVCNHEATETDILDHCQVIAERERMAQ